MLLLLLGACDLTKIGAYTCDEYCDQVVDKTEECAEAAWEAECEAQGAECDAMSEEELAEYAAQGREDWAGASRQDMVASCNADITEAEKTDAACQAETVTINNLSCDDILSLLGEIAAAAQ